MSFHDLSFFQSSKVFSYRSITPAAPTINLTADSTRKRFSLRNEKRVSPAKIFDGISLRAAKISTPIATLETGNSYTDANISKMQYAQATEKYQAAQSLADVYGFEARPI